MCGRFVSAAPPGELARYFDAAVPEAMLEPSYDVAPTNDVYAVLVDGEARRVDALHWGLVPFWAKDPKVGSRMNNARADKVATSGAFKRAFQRRRCLVPASPGFYEWRKLPGGKHKQPYFIQRADGEPLAFAGLWEVWRGADRQGEALRSCTIVTTTPNETLPPIHDRMPVILPPTRWEEWLDPTNEDVNTLGKLLVPAPASLLTAHPVSTLVNNVRHDGPELMAEAEPDELVG